MLPVLLVKLTFNVMLSQSTIREYEISTSPKVMPLAGSEWLGCLILTMTSAVTAAIQKLYLSIEKYWKYQCRCQSHDLVGSNRCVYHLCQIAAEASEGADQRTETPVRAFYAFLIFNHLSFQLFVTYGNQLANQVWAPAVPAAEQLSPESTDVERSKFIQDKYNKGRYRRVHTLASSPSMMDQV